MSTLDYTNLALCHVHQVNNTPVSPVLANLLQTYLVTIGSAAWFGPQRPKHPRPLMPVRPTGFLTTTNATRKCTLTTHCKTVMWQVSREYLSVTFSLKPLHRSTHISHDNTHLFILTNNSGFRRKNADLKNPAHWDFGVLLGFGLYLVFRFFYLNEQLRNLLVDLAHQLCFYLDSSVHQII